MRFFGKSEGEGFDDNYNFFELLHLRAIQKKKR